MFVFLAAFAVLIVAGASTGFAQSFTFTTLAGAAPGAIDGTGPAARFDAPFGIATDSAGNVYVADQTNDTIRKITAAGVVTTLAGTAGSVGSADGTGAAARFNDPFGVATDNAGNLYVADQGNDTIRKITPSGVVTTIAGTAGLSGSADGTGTAARFYNPTGVATDTAGNVYVADQGNDTIRKITPSGVVTTIAGTAGLSGSADGTGSAARFYSPTGIAIDSAGNLYVADYNNDTIRKVTPVGVVTTIAGTAGSAGSADGTGAAARFNAPTSVATDSTGNVYVADYANDTIRQVTPAGVVTTIAGTAGSPGSTDGTGAAARFNVPAGVATDSAGNLYVADQANDAIRKITPQGVVTTFAGTAGAPGSSDGTGTAASFHSPFGVTTDSAGNVYVADYRNDTIRKITPSGVVTTLAGTAGLSGSADGTGAAARFSSPIGVATDSAGNVYVGDFLNDTIRKITPAGVVTTLAGAAGLAGTTDGTGAGARFSGPAGVATDSAGNVYVADVDNQTIRKITPAGVVTTLAGTALATGSADGTGAAASFNHPIGVATDSAGNIYVADRDNQTIRKITPGGVVTTLAGTALATGSADGTGSAARFDNPNGVATDNAGNVYVADRGNDTIRKITPVGVVTTVGGTAGAQASVDGTGAAARFYGPTGVATDSAGNLYVADFGNSEIRFGSPAIADVATIDFATGAIGSPRQLDTAPQTATTWQWSVVRRPANSTSTFSSPTARNPLFTPDRADLFVIQLLATSSAGRSISTVNLTGTQIASTTTCLFSHNPALLGQSVTFSATVSASFGTPPGAVTFYDGATPLATVALDAFGRATFTTSSLTAGNHPISVVYSGEADYTGSTFGAANLSVSAASASTSTISATPASITANGTSTAAVTVQLKDSGGANVASSAGALALTTTAGVLSAVTDNGDGTYSATLTSSTTTATATIHGTIDGIPLTSTATVTFVAGPASAATSTIVASPLTIPADGTSYSTVTVQLKDANGNTVTSSGGTVGLTSNRGIWSAVTDHGDGTYTATLTSSTTVGVATITASLNGTTLTATATVNMGTMSAPAFITATATTPTSVAVTWPLVSNAASYQIARSSDGTTFITIGDTTLTSFTDISAMANTAYLYTVRAYSGGVFSPYTAPDLATTVMFDPIVAHVTVVQARHITDLRTAVNAVLALAGMQPATFTDPTITPGVTIVSTAHITELRTNLDAARSRLGLPAMSYTDPTLTTGSTVIAAQHILDLRSGVQ